MPEGPAFRHFKLLSSPCNVPAVLSQQSCRCCLVLTFPSRLTYHANLSRLTCQTDLSRLTCPSCPVPAVQLWLSCHAIVVLALLSCLAIQSGCPSPVVLSCLYCYGCPVPVVLSQLFCPCCHVLAILSSLSMTDWSIPADLSGQRVKIEHWTVPAVLPKLYCLGFLAMTVLSYLSCHVC